MEQQTAAFRELNGTFYQTFLQRLHSILRPRSYFEIGTLDGDTLKLACCPSISVDPEYKISANVIGTKTSCHFFQTKSDDFFERFNPKGILGDTIALAMLDGMHLFEFILRDFLNTERYCERDSVIVIHDCIPGDEYIAVRSPFDPRRQMSSRSAYWTGDVWKIIPALRQWRPDLRVTVVDSPPTGLVLVTNLDPASDILHDNYWKILDGYLHLDLGTYGVERLHEEADIVSTESLMGIEDLARLFTHKPR